MQNTARIAVKFKQKKKPYFIMVKVIFKYFIEKLSNIYLSNLFFCYF